MNWISVKDSLPVIPEGLFAVSVIGACYDKGFHECCPDNPKQGYSVQEILYSSVRRGDGKKLSPWEGTDIEFAFTEYCYGLFDDTDWVPCFNEVTHWMYLPEPPRKD